MVLKYIKIKKIHSCTTALWMKKIAASSEKNSETSPQNNAGFPLKPGPYDHNSYSFFQHATIL